MLAPRKLFLSLAGLFYVLVLVISKPQFWVSEAVGAPISDIRATRHNFSTTTATGASGRSVPARTIFSSSESEVCIFCHTPHGATADTPLWNRALSTQTYTLYSSTTLDSVLNAPGGSSKLCLSCHDGTLAPANVNNTSGSGTTGSISAGSGTLTKFDTSLTTGATSGFTRHIGGTAAQKDLSNDHPISVTYDSNLRTADGELRAPSGGMPMGLRSTGFKPDAPLEKTNGATVDGQVQCASCHDPHVVEQDTASFGTANKFLRLNRFQTTTSPDIGDGAFNNSTDISCLACHQKKGWGESSHGKSTVGDELHDPGKTINSTNRQFNIGASDTTGLPVYRAACLNCHDTHTVPGATRLLREGVTTLSGGVRTSSARRLENTCFQCHSPNSNAYNVLPTGTSGRTGLRLPSATSGGATVPDIETDFLTSTNKRMPIEQTTETHDIVNADFQECRKYLGGTSGAEDGSISTKCGTMPLTASNTNRHVECTDCHNPHRVRRGAKFYTTSLNTASDPGNYRTHIPASGTNGSEGNVASGALRGAWGVQPRWTLTTGSTTWPNPPTSFIVKKGDPGTSSTTGTYAHDGASESSVAYLSREYQLCFKCHSNYAYNDDNKYWTGSTDNQPASGRPALASPGTTSGTNSVTYYTNQGAEFAAFANDSITGLDQGENGNDTAYTPGNPNGAPNGAPNNHRSWHPVMWPTGRTRKERVNSDTSGDFTNIRAPFNVDANIGKQTMHCSDCHGHSGSYTAGTGPDYSVTQGPHGSDKNFLLKGDWSTSQVLTTGSYGLCGNCHQPNTAGSTGSGFGGGGEASHNSQKKQTRPCMWCHVAVPHGWRNKALLVNMNCVGPEGGGSGCQSNVIGDTANLTRGPYYVAARLRVKTWQASTNWSENSCDFPTGSKGGDWMTSTCGDR